MGYMGAVVYRPDERGKTLWKLTWGVLFVLAMTALSQWGPRLGYSKALPDATSAVSQPSQPMVHPVK
jgi:hypothetical protein